MPNNDTYQLHTGPPRIHPTAFIAPSADIHGDVEISSNASIWFQCTLRGDINRISIGPNTNVQDGTIIHVSNEFPAILGSHVSIGHRAIIHACYIHDEVLVGMGSIIMDGCIIGSQSIIAAGSLLTKNTQIPPHSLVLGSPARLVRPLTDAERTQPLTLAHKYAKLAKEYQ